MNEWMDALACTYYYTLYYCFYSIINITLTICAICLPYIYECGWSYIWEYVFMYVHSIHYFVWQDQWWRCVL